MSDKPAFVDSIKKGEKPDLKSTDTKTNDGMAQAKLLTALNKDHHGDLKHVEAPKESASSTQAKVLLAVQGADSTKLKKVSTTGAGLTDAQKQAYLEDKKSKASQS